MTYGNSKLEYYYFYEGARTDISLGISIIANNIGPLLSISWVTLNNASGYRTNGLYRTLNSKPPPNPSELA